MDAPPALALHAHEIVEVVAQRGLQLQCRRFDASSVGFLDVKEQLPLLLDDGHVEPLERDIVVETKAALLLLLALPRELVPVELFPGVRVPLRLRRVVRLNEVLERRSGEVVGGNKIARGEESGKVVLGELFVERGDLRVEVPHRAHRLARAGAVRALDPIHEVGVGRDASWVDSLRVVVHVRRVRAPQPGEQRRGCARKQQHPKRPAHFLPPRRRRPCP
mmetsp:Transcript_9430/g.15056  ORF Transcript_9430/g.15056 Transcript_9430/m.15056 type:complete len:220 (-) Transcript_9430:136-795(-)